MLLKAHTIQRVTYCDKDGNLSDRTIIPTFVPRTNIKAIDVSDLNEEERVVMLQQLLDYQEYVAAVTKTIFSFDNWRDHTKPDNETADISPKWRTFKIDKIEVLV